MNDNNETVRVARGAKHDNKYGTIELIKLKVSKAPLWYLGSASVGWSANEATSIIEI